MSTVAAVVPVPDRKTHSHFGCSNCLDRSPTPAVHYNVRVHCYPCTVHQSTIHIHLRHSATDQKDNGVLRSDVVVLRNDEEVLRNDGDSRNGHDEDGRPLVVVPHAYADGSAC